jgi:hypothetical protein
MDTKKIEQQIDTAITDEIKQKISSVYDSLVVNQPRGKIPEEIFKQHFLPYFAGEKPITTESKIMEQWISVAGTPMSEVNVINNTGEVLFSVPSLFDTKIIDTVIKDRKSSLTDIYTNSEVRSSRIPSEGIAYLARALTDKVQNIAGTSKVDIENKQRWETIMQRYDKQSKSNSSNTVNNSSNEDDFEY